MSNPAMEQVLRLCIGRLEDEMWREADALHDCGESEAALSLVCVELTQNDVSITRPIYEAIRRAAEELGLGESAFPALEALIRD